MDQAELLTPEQERALEEKAAELTEDFETELIIVIAKSLGGKTAEEYAADYYTSNGYGYGNNAEGILFLLSIESGEWFISTYGDNIYAFTGDDLKQIVESIYTYWGEGDAYGGFDVYLDTLESSLTGRRNGVPALTRPNDEPIEPVFGTVTASFDHSAGIREDGTVVFAGDMNDWSGEDAAKIGSWRDIVWIESSPGHLYALDKDGNLFTTWSSVPEPFQNEKFVQVVAEDYTLIGLKPDGTVVSGMFHGDPEKKSQVSNWKNIKAIDIGTNTMGLKSDGTVVIAGDRPPNVSGWNNITAVASGGRMVAGLRSDGTVLVAPSHPDYELFQYDYASVKDWTDIVAISAGFSHIVGLRSDGTVVAAGGSYSDTEACNVSDWTDIVAISAGYNYTISLKYDGTMVAIGNNTSGQCDVSDWTNIRTKNG